MKGNFWKEFNQGTQSAGHFFADWRAIGAVLAFVFCAIGSIILLSKTQITRQKTTGTVIATTSPASSNLCTKVQNSYTTDNQQHVIDEYQCTFTARYTINSKTYTHKFERTSTVEYKIGDSVDVYYDPKNVTDVSVTNEPDSRHIAGYILLTLTVIFYFASLGALFWLYGVDKEPAIAEGTGIGGSAAIAADAFKAFT